MNRLTTMQCPNCGASVDIDMNRAYVFCSYCGCKIFNEREQMGLNIHLGHSDISAHTDIESIMAAAHHYISIKDYEQANETVTAALLSGMNDYRIYIAKAKINLLTDNNAGLFEDLAKLRSMEEDPSNGAEVRAAIVELMQCRGASGVTILHNATFHEFPGWVQYCVERGSDVNCVAGMNRVTPISIMFVPLANNLSRLDGTPFVRNKEAVKAIRRYLLSKGARDIHRPGY